MKHARLWRLPPLVFLQHGTSLNYGLASPRSKAPLPPALKAEKKAKTLRPTSPPRPPSHSKKPQLEEAPGARVSGTTGPGRHRSRSSPGRGRGHGRAEQVTQAGASVWNPGRGASVGGAERNGSHKGLRARRRLREPLLNPRHRLTARADGLPAPSPPGRLQRLSVPLGSSGRAARLRSR